MNWLNLVGITLSLILNLTCVAFGQARSEKLRLRLIKNYPASFWAFANQAAWPRRSTGQEMVERCFGTDSLALAQALPKLSLAFDSASEQYLRGPGKDAELGQFSFTERFIQLAVQSPRLEDLLQHLTDILPGPATQDLIAALKTIEPLYRKRIWEAEEARLDSHMVALNRKVDSADVSGIVNRAAQFYGTDLKGLRNFDILFSPIPGEIPFTMATPYDTLLFLDLHHSEKDYAGLLSVAVHEVCHVLWRHRRQKAKEAWSGAFKTTAGKMTLVWLDESLATAIGNGIAYKEMSGHYETRPWYFDPVLDTLGRAYASVIEPYLSEGRQVDPAVLSEFENRFRLNFPDYLHRPEILFPYQYVFAPDEAAINVFRTEQNNHFSLRGSQAGYPYSLDDLKGFHEDTKVGTRVLLLTSMKQARAADRILKMPRPLATEAFRKNKAMTGISRSQWPIVFLPVRIGKLPIRMDRPF